MIGLTVIQAETLSWIEAYIKTHGYSPSLRDVGDAFGISAMGASCRIDALKRKGAIQKEDSSARTIRVVYKRQYCGTSIS
jgi:repressor LexA